MKFSDEELRDFFNEIEMCYTSGISVMDSIDIVRGELDDGDLRNALETVAARLHEGNNLYNSMSEVEGFDSYLLNVIRVGEQTGYLDRVLRELGSYYGRLYSMRKKLREALTYPVILLFSMMIILFVLVSRILPIFKEVLNSMGTDLNVVAYMLMDIGDFISTSGLLIVLVIVVFSSVYYFYNRYRYKEKWFTNIFYRSVFTRKLSSEFSVSKYLYGLNLLLKSGYYDESSLDMLNSLVENEVIRKSCEQIASEFSSDRNLAGSVIKSGILDSRNNKLLSIGYHSGKTDDVIDRICSDYENNVDDAIDRFINRVEPVMITVCVLLVGIILLSVMMPLISIMAGL